MNILSSEVIGPANASPMKNAIAPRVAFSVANAVDSFSALAGSAPAIDLPKSLANLLTSMNVLARLVNTAVMPPPSAPRPAPTDNALTALPNAVIFAVALLSPCVILSLIVSSTNAPPARILLALMPHSLHYLPRGSGSLALRL